MAVVKRLFDCDSLTGSCFQLLLFVCNSLLSPLLLLGAEPRLYIHQPYSLYMSTDLVQHFIHSFISETGWDYPRSLQFSVTSCPCGVFFSCILLDSVRWFEVSPRIVGFYFTDKNSAFTLFVYVKMLEGSQGVHTSVVLYQRPGSLRVPAVT